MSNGEIDRAFKMFHERCPVVFVIVKRHARVQNVGIARFADVGIHAGYKPQRIVIESAANIGVAALGKRLVLVPRGAVRQLNGRNVDNSLSRLFGQNMCEPEQVLAGIAEAHSASDAALVITRASAHAIGDKALILIPYIDHTVEFFVGSFYGEFIEEFVPCGAEFVEFFQSRLFACVFFDKGDGLFLVDNPGGFPFFVFGVFNVTQKTDERPFFAGRKSQVFS